MKNIFYLLVFIPSMALAYCTLDQVSGDRTCVEGNVSYTYPSEATLNKMAQEQAQREAIINAERTAQQKEADLQAVDAKSVRALRAVMAKSCDNRDADCQVLKTKEAEAKAVRDRP